MQVLKTKSFERFCFLNENTFLWKIPNQKDFETYFSFDNKELVPFYLNQTN
jgi:hypothetical protein